MLQEKIMKEQKDSMPETAAAPEPCFKLVSISVSDDHPFLQLKRELDWEAIRVLMGKHWRKAGKNVDGGPGRPWPVELYVPLVVLLLARSITLARWRSICERVSWRDCLWGWSIIWRGTFGITPASLARWRL